MTDSGSRRHSSGRSRNPSGRRGGGPRRTPWKIVLAWLVLVLVLVGLGVGVALGVRTVGSLLAKRSTPPASTPATASVVPSASLDASQTAEQPATQTAEPGQPADEGDGIKIGTYLGNETRRFYGIGPVPEKLKVIWRAKIGSGKTSGTAKSKGPVVWSGTGWTGQPTLVRDQGRLYVIVGGFDHGLRKIDASTGKTVWRYEFPDVIKGSNTVWIDPEASTEQGRIKIVCGSRRGFGLSLSSPGIAPVRCVSFATGKELWRLPVPHSASYSRDADGSAIFRGGVLYQGVESGHMYKLDPTVTKKAGSYRNPKILATSLLYEKGDSSAHGGNLVLEGSPCVIGDNMYVEAGSGHIYGLRLSDLKKVWDFKTGSDLDSTAASTQDGYLLAGIEKQYIKGKGGVIKLDPRKPAAKAGVWYLPTGDRKFGDWLGGVIGSVAINDDYDPDGTRPPLAAVSAIDGYLYVFSQNETKGSARIFDGKRSLPTPVIVAKKSIGGAISTPIIVDDHIIAAGYDAKVHVYRIVYDAKGGGGVKLKTRDGRTVRVSVVETGSFRAGGFESTPVVWNGRIYVGSRDGYLYCLGAK